MTVSTEARSLSFSGRFITLRKTFAGAKMAAWKQLVNAHCQSCGSFSNGIFIIALLTWGLSLLTFSFKTKHRSRFMECISCHGYFKCLIILIGNKKWRTDSDLVSTDPKGGKKSLFGCFSLSRAAGILALIKGKRNAAFPVKTTILIVADSQ